jgi:hypothetical protein
MKCFSSINNDSDLMPNHAQWLRRDLWRIDHAVCLLRNVEPEEAANLLSLMDGFKALYTGDIQTVLSAENISLDIEGPESHGEGLSIQYSKVRPKVFIQWADSKGYEIPQPFQFLLNGPQEEDTGVTKDSNEERHQVHDTSTKTSKLDERVERILELVKIWFDDPLNIPDGGKANIKKTLCRLVPTLFTDSTFEKAWQKGKKGNLFEIENVEQYRTGK